jgi:hypothetical protein
MVPAVLEQPVLLAGGLDLRLSLGGGLAALCASSGIARSAEVVCPSLSHSLGDERPIGESMVDE